MRIHHLNCISACPLGGALMDGFSHNELHGRLTTHCLLIEAAVGLVLVDTGYGMRDVADPKGRLSKFFLTMNDPELRDELTAYRQIQRLGFDPADVRHIVLSHLDFDHAGGLDDFPAAEVHMLAAERESAVAQRTLLDRMRYRPQQWHTQNMWRVYPGTGERWFDFGAVRELPGMSAEILMIPLVGHTLGHAGVAVRYDSGWLLYAADAYFYHAEMDLEHPRCTPGLRFYQTLMEKDRGQRLHNQARLRELKRRQGDVIVFCAHDVHEFEALSGRSHRELPPSRTKPAVAQGLNTDRP
jgi:glyoxylase-like metal-dependent hydrolase (beta-lactamase superfamily II)